MTALQSNPAVESDAFRMALRSTPCAPHCERWAASGAEGACRPKFLEAGRDDEN
jgi:hypothetical protein